MLNRITVFTAVLTLVLSIPLSCFYAIAGIVKTVILRVCCLEFPFFAKRILSFVFFAESQEIFCRISIYNVLFAIPGRQNRICRLEISTIKVISIKVISIKVISSREPGLISERSPTELIPLKPEPARIQTCSNRSRLN